MTVSRSFQACHLEPGPLPGPDEAEAWKQGTARHYRVSDLHLTAANEAHLYIMGDVTLADVRHPTQTFTRDAALIRRDGADPILFLLQLERPSPIYVDGVQSGGDVGQATFLDLAQPHAKSGGPGRMICLTVQRDALRGHLSDPGALTQTPDSVWRALLAEHLRLLAANAPQFTPETASHLGRSLVELVAACAAAPEARERAQPTVESLLRRRVIASIDELLADPELSPELLSQHLKVPRSTLYRLGAPAGGISTLVRERRLRRARQALSGEAPPPSIQEVAFACGFRSEAQFSRAFRRRFGMTPSDARSQARAARSARLPP